MRLFFLILRGENLLVEKIKLETLMTRSLLSFLIVFLVPLHILFSQPEDPVLFTVDGVPVQ